MTALGIATQTVTAIHAELVEDTTGANYGNAAYDWPGAERHDLTGCSVQPVAEVENTEPGRDAQPATIKVWQYDLSYEVQATDRLEWAGETYEVNGTPERWRTGVLDHDVVTARRVVG